MEILLAISILLICFYVLAVLTEEFFVSSIDIIAKRLKMSSDAAGATLLAIGSSAPEFFTSLFAVLGTVGTGRADIGAGTIVGSAIFNILVIIGASAMFKSVKLQWKPVIRDLSFYIITILLLLWSFSDGKIVLFEAVTFVLAYAIYVFIVVNWKKWLNYRDQGEDIETTPDEPKNALHSITNKLISYVVPNPSEKPKLYIATFILSIAGIALISWVLVEQIIVLAGALNINATFLALTVLAAGTSIPDLIGSIVVAKQGRGDMSVSNAVGSNIFDILFGLGFPWLLALIIVPGHIAVGKENLNSSVLLLFATVVSILFLLIIRNWKIGHKSGIILITLYIAYCVYIALTVA